MRTFFDSNVSLKIFKWDKNLKETNYVLSKNNKNAKLIDKQENQCQRVCSKDMCTVA